MGDNIIVQQQIDGETKVLVGGMVGFFGFFVSGLVLSTCIAIVAGVNLSFAGAALLTFLSAVEFGVITKKFMTKCKNTETPIGDYLKKSKVNNKESNKESNGVDNEGFRK